MAVQQTECYRVVTIGYLKTFIGDLIQDSSNGSVIHISRTDDTYCPTYSELTGGTIIQTWDPGDASPNGDKDGIVVNSSAILGGNYAENQLVDQRDLSLMYTRINSFSISVSSEWISACSGETVVSYTHTYNRNSKFMNSSCTIQNGGNTAVTDTNDSEVTLSTSSFGIFGGWSNHTKTLTIPKNSSSTGQADERYTNVSGDITFRGSGHTHVVRVNQYALTGSTSYVVTTYTATTSVAAYPSTNQTFTDCSEHAWGAYGVRYYDIIERRCWIDNCGDIYPSISSDTVVGSEQVDVGTSAGTFSAVNCPDTSCSNSVNVTFTADGRTSNTLVFQRSGSNSCVYCTCSVAGLGTQVSNTVTSSKVRVATYSSSDCSGTWQVTGLRSGTDFLDQNSIEFSNGYIYAAVGADNTSEDVRQAQYNVAIMNGSTEECSDYFTVYQRGTEPPPPHTGDTPTEPQYSFAPDYPDGSGVVVDRGRKNYGIRGTDNGAEIRRARGGCSQCLPAGTEFIFVAPEVNAWNTESASDMIRVNTIYIVLNGTKVNLRDFTQSNKLDLGDGVKIWFKEHDTDQGWYDSQDHLAEYSHACNSIQIEFEENRTSSWRTIKIELATDDEYAKQWWNVDGEAYSANSEIANNKVATSWEYQIWQAPQGCNVVDTDITGSYPGEHHSGWSHCG